MTERVFILIRPSEVK